MAYTGHDQFVCARNHLRIRGDDGVLSQRVQCLLHRGQISRAVVDDCDRHSTPFVLGMNSAMRGSRQHAARTARANALNSDSILW